MTHGYKANRGRVMSARSIHGVILHKPNMAIGGEWVGAVPFSKASDARSSVIVGIYLCFIQSVYASVDSLDPSKPEL